MAAPDTSPAQRRAARIAGFLFLFVIVGSLLHVSVLLPRLLVAGDAAATAARITASPLLFRAGTVIELVMAACVVALAVALHVLLAPVGRGLALLALTFRMVEAILWTVVAVVTATALPILGARPPGGERDALAAAFLAARAAGSDALVLFTGLGTFAFFLLLWRSHYAPRPLVAWGLVSYATCVVFPILKLLSPGVAPFELWVYSPGGLFEIAMGLWLLVVGVRRPAAPAPHPVM